MAEISVIIPVYNQETHIEKTIDDLLNQTFKDIEIIVVNDGSTDSTAKTLKKYQDKIILINQNNQGASSARNRGLSETKSPYIIFCDSDISLKPNMLEKLYQGLQQNPEKSYAYSSFYYGVKKFKVWPFDAERLKSIPYIHTTSLIRREHFPGFDENLKRFQDWDVWLTMLEQGHTGIFIDEFLFTVKPGGTISKWVPKILFKLPFKTKQIKKYQAAEQILKKKHNL